MSGHKNLTAQLKSLGVDAGKTDKHLLPPEHFIVVMTPGQPYYDPSVNLPLKQAMVDHIGEHGVMQDVRVKRDGEDRNGMPRLIITDGRGRVLHAREWNRQHPDRPVRVPYVVETGTELEAVLRSCGVNAYRINTSLMSEAYKARQAINLGATEAQVCAALNKSAAEVADLMTLLDLAPEAQQMVEARTMPRTSVRELAKLPRVEQGKAAQRVAEHTKGRKAKVHEVRAIVTSVRAGEDTTEMPARLRTMGRAEVEGMVSKIDAWRGDGGPRTDEQIEAAQAVSDALRHVLGYDGALTLDWLREVLR